MSANADFSTPLKCLACGKKSIEQTEPQCALANFSTRAVSSLLHLHTSCLSLCTILWNVNFIRCTWSLSYPLPQHIFSLKWLHQSQALFIAYCVGGSKYHHAIAIAIATACNSHTVNHSQGWYWYHPGCGQGDIHITQEVNQGGCSASHKKWCKWCVSLHSNWYKNSRTS